MRIVVLILAFFLVAAGLVQSAPFQILLDVKEAELAWADSRLTDKLVTELSRQASFSVLCPSRNSGVGSAFPNTRTNTDSLLNWGAEMGGRHLLVITVDREALERRKGFNLPLVFHKYETVGVIEGEYRLLDLTKGRLLAVEPFSIELEASKQIQAEFDDNRNDPNLHLTAPEKSALFGQLEDKLIEWLV